VIDLHAHSWRCRHGEGTPDEYVKAASERGVSVLAFTEHLPLAPAIASRVPGAQEYAMPLAELDDYVAEVGRAAVLGASLGVEVLLGIEIDAVPAGFQHARALLDAHPFDLVLGSVHFIGDWAFDDPALIGQYAHWQLDDLWNRYFDELVTAARSSLADVMAHADLVKKFCGRPESGLAELYATAASAFAEAGVAVEVNTAGLRKPCAEIYPSLPFLRALRSRGVPVTIGSDAHRPSEVGADAGLAVELLREAGFASVVVYRQRSAEEVGLDEL